MLLSQVIRRVAITGRTDGVGERVLGRHGGQWTHQWIESAFMDAASRTHGAPLPAHAENSLAVLEDPRGRGLLTEDEFERLRATRGG